MLALLICTWQRNTVWSSTITLWEDAAAKSPNKYRVWGNLGTAYGESARFEDALCCYQKARDLQPRYETAYVNAATILNNLRRSKEAYAECHLLIQRNPEAEFHAEVQHNLGVSQIGIGDVKAGMSRLEDVVKSFPDYRPSQVMLGLVYSRLHEPREALRYWQNAVRIQPAEPQLKSLIRAAEIAANRSSK
jgi:tetratricopeptide (TPR) repeat protein